MCEANGIAVVCPFDEHGRFTAEVTPYAGEQVAKLSKRLRNYPDPVEVFDQLGSDAMRWELLSSPAAVEPGIALRR